MFPANPVVRLPLFLDSEFIRDEKPGFINKILRLEQEGERQHAEMNSLEDKNKKTMQKGLRYWQMIRDKENKMYA